ncbi:hypothetical protein HBI56_094790 [Parastagonospora nodorum]|uniref:Secreted protein n=1 Tax=Phaeosphaeria nodorum (strain SN15 / ATCC MYA-4574 / FGSC 10173) TaxID=321614 RepID=A0A7U2F3V3_PHANO|nr:hypothetical protein HBH56_090080 [Parastagonospora nodorum]QRC98192.1 hypothetical protein JI435_411680 [Parastagonospora nodorum SN15]KAH3936671.1 hypothetical protein HBH54_024720 [Parastagonospora nodorum]KAH3945703.1 hypothetical protein HBH53_141820 [Parastagonospora nodorum]KAH3966341.1 hypothetical protein HBH51_143550 [Parastagonospora nodorum]
MRLLLFVTLNLCTRILDSRRCALSAPCPSLLIAAASPYLGRLIGKLLRPRPALGSARLFAHSPFSRLCIHPAHQRHTRTLLPYQVSLYHLGFCVLDHSRIFTPVLQHISSSL